MKECCSKANLVGLALLLLTSCVAPPRAFRAPDAPQPQDDRRVRDTLERIFTVMEREVARNGGCPYDVPARSAALGFDEERIYKFVRDEIVTEPYRGVQRGPRGVLASKGGNPLEKALLLQALLQAAGMPSRIMQGDLDGARAAQIVDRFLNSAPSSTGFEDVSARESGEEALLEELASEIGIRKDLLGATRETHRKSAIEHVERAWKLAGPHRDSLEKAVREAGATPEFEFAPLRAQLEKDVRTHYWVETRRALDPCFQDAKPGTTYAKGGKPLATLPDAERAWLTVQLELDRTEGDRRERKILVAVRVRIEDSLFESITVRVLPAEPLPDMEQLSAKAAEELYSIGAGVKKFQAVLYAGSTQYASQPFDTEGKMHEVEANGEMKRLGSAATRLNDPLGGQPPKEPPTKLHGLLLRLKLERPGRDAAVQTRSLFESPKDEASPFFGLHSEIDLLVQPHWLTPESAAYLPVYVLLQNRESLLAAAEGRFVTPARRVRLQTLLFQFALLRQYAMARILREGKNSIGFLWSSPAILARHKRIRFHPRTKEMSFVKIVDIVENEGPFVPRSPEAAATAWRSNLALGVYDSCLEGMLLEEADRTLYTDYAVRHFERARLEGASPSAILPKDRDARLSSAISASDREWIRECGPPEGVIAIAGPSPARQWWSVDPRTGSSVARVSGGGGQALAEYQKVATVFLAFWMCAMDRIWDAGTAKERWKGAKLAYHMVRVASCIIGLGLGLLGVAVGGIPAMALCWAAMESAIRMWGIFVK